MSGILEVVDSGVAVTIQDRGRTGFRDIGVPVSGALDPFGLAAANALLGNAPDAPALELLLGGPSLKSVSGTVRVALGGSVEGRVVGCKGTLLKVPPWHTATLFPGDVIQLGAVNTGVAYIAVSGGFLIPEQLGSRSTYVRAGLGGIKGRALVTGDHLPCGRVSGDPWLEYRGREAPAIGDGPIRVILGPQDDHFSSAAIAAFLRDGYRVGREMDRMGMRLEGAQLAHNELGAEIVSDGVAPGAIQVPANGLPIVLLADCQTSGGYPKVATVIRADLGRFGHLRPGDEIHFAAVGHVDAAQALRERLANLTAWISTIESFRPPGVIDEAALYGGNLVSGVLRGDEPFELP